MSAIQDALKRAQRERQKRTTAAAGLSGSAPLLVPLRSTAQSTFSWGRALGIGVGGAVLIGAVILGVQIMQASRRPALPSVPLPMAADQIVTPPATAAVRIATSSPSRIRSDELSKPGRLSSRPGPIQAQSREPSSPAAVAGVTPNGVQEPIAALPQGRPRSESGTVTSSDRLRIAVDRPRNEEAARLFAEAVVAHRANDLTAARGLYEQALALTPADADLLNNYGVLLSSQHELDTAIEFLRRSVTLAPQNAGAWTNLGFAYRERGRGADAVAALQRALAIDPRRPGVQISLAQQYIAMGSITQARELVDRIIASDSTSAEAHYTRGQVLEMLGDRPGAVRAYENFLRLAPPRLESYSERVRRHLDTLGAKGTP